MSNLTPNTWLLILFAIVPGFVANRVYALWCPTQKQDWEKALLEPITWSAVNLLFWWWLVLPILQTPFDQINGWYLSGVTAVVCTVSPTILASLWYRFRRSNWAHQKLGFDHPTPRGWDFFLQKKTNFFVLFHLKDKRMVGGYFGSESYASTYPQEPEIYVEVVWQVDQITGKFLSPVVGSFGSVIRQSEWERIEFLQIPSQLEETANVAAQEDSNSEEPSTNGEISEPATTGLECYPLPNKDPVPTGIDTTEAKDTKLGTNNVAR